MDNTFTNSNQMKKKSRGIYHFFLVVLLFTLFFSFNSSRAQEEEKTDTLKYEIKDVVVTGTRTQERMIDVPFSVFKVDKVELSLGRKTIARDVLADVPGLFLQTQYSNHSLRISLRGYGSRSNTGVRGIKILQQGIPVSEPDGQTVVDDIDFTSLSGVEVVKGNLSSLYSNAPGGVINFTTDITFPESFVMSANQFGGYGLRQNGFKVGVATSGYRFFLSYYYRNNTGYRPHAGEYQHLVNAVYQGYIGNKSLLTILGAYTYGDIKLPGSLTQEEFNADPYQANPLAVSQDYKSLTKKGRIGVKFETTFGKSNNNEIEISGYGGVKNGENAGYQYYSYATRYSLGSILKFTNKSNILNHENKFTIGMDYAYQSGPVLDFDNIGGQKDITLLQNNYNGSLSNIGFYLMNHYNLIAEKFDVFLLSRFDKNVFTNTIFLPSYKKDNARSMQNFAPKLGLNYKLTPYIALYSSYGLSYDYPALSELENTALSTNPQLSLDPDLNPEKSYNFELGIKGNVINSESEFMRKVFFDITFFDYQVKNEIVPYLIFQDTYFRTANKTRRVGLESGIKTEPFEGIEFTVNYTWTNFKYIQYQTILQTSSGNKKADFSGNKVPAIPIHSVNIILNYEYELSDDLSGLLQWDCDYFSKMYANDGNTEYAPGYFYGNVMAGLNVKLNNYKITGYVGLRNIFDKKYIGFVNINDYLGRYYEPGEPRYFFMGLNFSYQL